MTELYVEFTGKETESEFLQKCIKQWEDSMTGDAPDYMKQARLSIVLRELKARHERLTTPITLLNEKVRGKENDTTDKR